MAEPGKVDIRLLQGSELASLQQAFKEMGDSMAVFQQGAAELRQAAEIQMSKTFAEPAKPFPLVPGKESALTASGQVSTHSSKGAEAQDQVIAAAERAKAYREQAQQESATEKLQADGISDAPSGSPSAGASSHEGHPEDLSRGTEDLSDVGSGQPPPGIVNPNDPWHKRVQDELNMQEKLKLPQYGEWTVQNKLFMAAQGPAWYAREHPEAPGATAASVVAGALGKAEQWYPYAEHLATRLAGQGGAPGILGVNLQPGATLDRYQQAGLDATRGGTIQDIPGVGRLFEALDINARLPAPIRMLTTEAGRQALEDFPDRMKIRHRYAGMDDERWDLIEKEAASRGVLKLPTKQRLQYFDVASQMTSGNWGIQDLSPEIAMETFNKVWRQVMQGNDSLSDFEVTMRGVDEAARATNMSTDEFMQQMNALTEQMEGLSSTTTNALETGRAWSSITGSQPGTLGKLLENPFVSGRMAASAGLMPHEVGLLPAGAIGGSVLDTMKLMEAPYRGLQGKTQEITDPVTGEKVGDYEIASKARREAAAAQDMGIDVGEYRRIKQRSRKEERAFPITEAVQTWTETMREDAAPRGSARRRRLLREEGTDIISGREIVGMMENAKIGTAEERGKLGQLMHEKPREAQEYANKLIDKYVGKEDPSTKGRRAISIELTDDAKKLVKATWKDEKAARREEIRRRKAQAKEALEGPTDPAFPARPGGSSKPFDSPTAGSSFGRPGS